MAGGKLDSVLMFKIILMNLYFNSLTVSKVSNTDLLVFIMVSELEDQLRLLHFIGQKCLKVFVSVIISYFVANLMDFKFFLNVSI